MDKAKYFSSTLHKKCPNTVFLVRFKKNTEQKKLRIWTLFILFYFSKIQEPWQMKDRVLYNN